MRMRKKKNLETRLEDCGDYLINCKSESLNYEEAEEHPDYFDYKELFGNDNDIVVEIGCGKGQFGCTYAKENPNINMICVEKVGNVIVSACELARKMELKNIKFVKCGAEYLNGFLKNDSVSALFLNFSCPYPKKSYAKHRLTHERFLNIYKKFLVNGAPIYQKTDNMHFFEFSIEHFSKCGFTIKNVSLDLHNSDFEGNIETEYEKRFSEMGMPIYRLEAYLNK